MQPPLPVCSSQRKPWWPSVRRRPLRQCPRLAAWGEWTSRSASLLTPLPAGARVRVSAASPFLAASSERGGWGQSLVCRGRRGTRQSNCGRQHSCTLQALTCAGPWGGGLAVAKSWPRTRRLWIGGSTGPEPAEPSVSPGQLRTNLHHVRCKYHRLPRMAPQGAGSSHEQRQGAFGPPNGRHCGDERHRA